MRLAACPDATPVFTKVTRNVKVRFSPQVQLEIKNRASLTNWPAVEAAIDLPISA
jgi:hypothetical protein